MIRLSTLCVLLLVALAAFDARAALFQVANTYDSDNGSLRQAILNANAAPDEPHFIHFLEEAYPADGVIVLQSPLPPITARDLTISGEVSNPVIDGDHAHRILLSESSNERLKLERLEFRNGYSNGSPGQGGSCVGSVWAVEGELVLERTTFRNCVLDANALRWGGAVRWSRSQGSLDISDSRFIGNRVSAVSSGGGGAVDASTRITRIRDSWFEGNLADVPTGAGHGGAIYASGETIESMEISGSSFISNTASPGLASGGSGGFLHASCATCVVQLERNWVSGNYGVDGGALVASQGYSPGSGVALKLFNNVFHQNIASLRGGAVALRQGVTMEAVNNSFVFNDAPEGADLSFQSYPTVQAFRANLMGITEGWGGASCSGSASVSPPATGLVRLNLILGEGCGGHMANQALPSEDLGALHLVTNGFGEAPSVVWFDGSDVLDAITDATACEAIDIHGNPRPFDADGDGAADCDVGAYEWTDDSALLHVFADGFED